MYVITLNGPRIDACKEVCGLACRARALSCHHQPAGFWIVTPAPSATDTGSWQ
jgi:hypothetical protein